MKPTVSDLLSAGRLQEAEWLIRSGHPSPLTLVDLAHQLGTSLDPKSFFVSPGFYAPLPSWSAARSLCGHAYEASSVLDRYRNIANQSLCSQQPQIFLSSYAIRQLAALHHAWLSLGQPSVLRVLDFGGALGNHFYSLSPHWHWSSLQWVVCETDSVATVGQSEYEGRYGVHRICFNSDPLTPLQGGIDVVFASCSLQYLEDWVSMLHQFREAPWLLVDRVPLIDYPTDIIDIQVVPASYTDTRYPGWKFSSSKWFSCFQDLGYSLVWHWFVPEDHWSILDLETGSFRWHADNDHGFLFRSNSCTTQPIIF